MCRSVFGTLRDQRLFSIAAFFNLTADYADDTDLIPTNLNCRQARRLPFILSATGAIALQRSAFISQWASK
jgi:hypothetical protein